MSDENSIDKNFRKKEGNFAKYLSEVFFFWGGGEKIEGRPNMGSEVGGGVWRSEKR